MGNTLCSSCKYSYYSHRKTPCNVCYAGSKWRAKERSEDMQRPKAVKVENKLPKNCRTCVYNHNGECTYGGSCYDYQGYKPKYTELACPHASTCKYAGVDIMCYDTGYEDDEPCQLYEVKE